MNGTTETRVGDARTEAEEGQEEKYLTFFIGEECYGLETRHVIEIIGMQKLTAIPDAPHYLRGVINLRGKVIPVMDIRLRFGIGERAYDDRTCIIVIEAGSHVVGLAVDTVSEVLDIPADQIEPIGRIVDAQSGRFIKGMGKVGEAVKILLDARKVLGEEAGL